MHKETDSEYIDLESSIKAKASPDCKPIKFRAVAGVSDAELVERYTIGEYQPREENEEAEETNSD